MTTDTAAIVRTWVAALTLAGFLLLWAILARAPFPAASGQPTAGADGAGGASGAGTAPGVAASADPRATALARRERALRIRAAGVRQRHTARWAAYRRALGERQALIRAVAAAPVPAFSTSPVSSGGGASAAAPAPAATSTRSS